MGNQHTSGRDCNCQLIKLANSFRPDYHYEETNLKVTKSNSVKKLISKRDRGLGFLDLIRESWKDLQGKGPHYVERLLRKTWLRASTYSPKWVVNFLDMVIVTHELNTETLQMECARLGARHIKYFSEGFQPGYWDSFSVSMVEGIEESLKVTDEKGNTDIEREDECWRVLYAWQKFIRVIIDFMRVAYQNGVAKKMLATNGAAGILGGAAGAMMGGRGRGSGSEGTGEELKIPLLSATTADNTPAATPLLQRSRAEEGGEKKDTEEGDDGEDPRADWNKYLESIGDALETEL